MKKNLFIYLFALIKFNKNVSKIKHDFNETKVHLK